MCRKPEPATSAVAIARLALWSIEILFSISDQYVSIWTAMVRVVENIPGDSDFASAVLQLCPGLLGRSSNFNFVYGRLVASS